MAKGIVPRKVENSAYVVTDTVPIPGERGANANVVVRVPKEDAKRLQQIVRWMDERQKAAATMLSQSYPEGGSHVGKMAKEKMERLLCNCTKTQIDDILYLPPAMREAKLLRWEEEKEKLISGILISAGLNSKEDGFKIRAYLNNFAPSHVREIAKRGKVTLSPAVLVQENPASRDSEYSALLLEFLLSTKISQRESGGEETVFAVEPPANKLQPKGKILTEQEFGKFMGKGTLRMDVEIGVDSRKLARH